jgi:hypothetical protein
VRNMVPDCQLISRGSQFADTRLASRGDLGNCPRQPGRRGHLTPAVTPTGAHARVTSGRQRTAEPGETAPRKHPARLEKRKVAGSTQPRPSSGAGCQAVRHPDPGRTPAKAAPPTRARAPRVPGRAGNHGEQRPTAGSGQGEGPRPRLQVRGHIAAEAEGFEPSVTSLPRRFSRPFP